MGRLSQVGAARRLPQGMRSTPPGSLAVSYMLTFSPVAWSMASMRPCRRTGLAQLLVAASCCSQRGEIVAGSEVEQLTG
jgi:hypothetical protein